MTVARQRKFAMVRLVLFLSSITVSQSRTRLAAAAASGRLYLCFRGRGHGFDDFGIGGAAAEIAGEIVADVVFAWLRIGLQKLVRHQHEARRAEAALEGAAVDEGLLHG